MTHDLYLQLTWRDPVTGCLGYLVIDRLIRGVCGGGLRMRDGCTLGEVADLARGMSLKEAIAYTEGDHYLPLGGAKGGIDFNPYDPRARGVLERYVAAMLPLLERHWSAGEDFGVQQAVLDELVAEAGLRSSAEALLQLVDDPDRSLRCIAEAFAVEVDGVGLADLVGGYGVAEAAFAAMAHVGMPVDGARAVVQGFGSMGGATARYLAAAGVRVVGIADVQGVVANPDGLDVERLLLTRDERGTIDRAQLRPADRELPAVAWLQLEAEVLVPAAMSYVLTEDNWDAVQARLVVEASNSATVPPAERRLAERGVAVVPDFVANLATNSWWGWTLFGDIRPERDDAFAKIAATMRRLVGGTLARARRDGVLPRAAAEAMARENLARMEAELGGEPLAAPA